MYIDSNIFVLAAIDKGELGNDCRDILKAIESQKLSCAASVLVIDETVWVVKKKEGKEKAIRIGKAMLSLPIKWMAADKAIAVRMMDIFEKNDLSPRDSIHVSSMKEGGLTSILSEDSDFDRVVGITRVTAAQCVKKFAKV